MCEDEKLNFLRNEIQVTSDMQMQRENEFEKQVAENIKMQFEKQDIVRNIIFEKVKQEYEEFKDYRYKFDNQMSDLIQLVENKVEDKRDWMELRIKDQLKDAIEYL